ncbi:MAG: PKD domain-containing protein [archaeon]
MFDKGQTSVELLLLLGGAVVAAVIIITLTLTATENTGNIITHEIGEPIAPWELDDQDESGFPIADACGTDCTDRLYYAVNGLITLDGSESKDSDGTIENYRWTLDNQIITECDEQETCDYTLPADGFYTIKLIVTDNDGKTGSDTVNVVVGEGVFFVNITGNNFAMLNDNKDYSYETPGGTVKTGSEVWKSKDPEQEDFIEETSCKGKITCKITFDDLGDWEIFLEVENGEVEGEFASDTHQVSVTKTPPDLDISFDQTLYTAATLAEINLSLTVNGGVEPITYDWELYENNDCTGTPENILDFCNGENNSDCGPFTLQTDLDTVKSNCIKVTATDNDGGTDTGTTNIDVYNRSPVSEAGPTKYSQRAGNKFDLYLDGSESIDLDTALDFPDIITYDWDLIEFDGINETWVNGLCEDIKCNLPNLGIPEEYDEDAPFHYARLTVTDSASNESSDKAVIRIIDWECAITWRLTEDEIGIPNGLETAHKFEDSEKNLILVGGGFLAPNHGYGLSLFNQQGDLYNNFKIEEDIKDFHVFELGSDWPKRVAQTFFNQILITSKVEEINILENGSYNIVNKTSFNDWPTQVLYSPANSKYYVSVQNNNSPIRVHDSDLVYKETLKDPPPVNAHNIIKIVELSDNVLVYGESQGGNVYKIKQIDLTTGERNPLILWTYKEGGGEGININDTLSRKDTFGTINIIEINGEKYLFLAGDRAANIENIMIFKRPNPDTNPLLWIEEERLTQYLFPNEEIDKITSLNRTSTGNLLFVETGGYEYATIGIKEMFCPFSEILNPNHGNHFNEFPIADGKPGNRPLGGKNGSTYNDWYNEDNEGGALEPGDTVTLDASDSIDYDGEIVHVRWEYAEDYGGSYMKGNLINPECDRKKIEGQELDMTCDYVVPNIPDADYYLRVVVTDTKDFFDTKDEDFGMVIAKVS